MSGLRAKGGLFVLPVCLIMIFALAACGGNGEQTPAGTGQKDAQEEFRIGIAWAELQSGYFSNIRNFAHEHAEELGVEINETDATFDVAKQLDQIDQLLVQGIDVLVISPISSEGALPGIEAANAADVPVITFDRTVPGAEDKIVTHVGASAEETGYINGRMMCELISPDAKVLRARGVAGDEGSNLRQKGFLRAQSEEDCSGMKVLDEQFTNFDADRIVRIVSDWLEVYGPGEADVIMHDGDLGLDGVLELLRSADREDIYLVGAGNYGGFPKAICDGNLKEGAAFGTVDFKLKDQGEAIVDTAIAIRDGKADELPDWVKTDIFPITADNCEENPPVD